MEWKKILLTLLICITTIFFVACGTKQQQEPKAPAEKPDTETKLTVAYSVNPPNLDPHMSTAMATAEISRNIFEQLVTIDSKFQVQPMLAESYEVSQDLKNLTFHLRKGIKFHNGKEMKAEDVVASVTKWAKTSAVGKAEFTNAAFETPDDYTVIIKLQNPSSFAIMVLASPMQFCGIMPKEIAESAGSSGVTEYIGTGPFKLKDWEDDQYVTLIKYDEYQALTAPADGLAGKKEALVDILDIKIVKDVSTRVSGVQTGLYDIAIAITRDTAEQLKSDSNLKLATSEYGFPYLVFNRDEEVYKGFFTNIKARQAVAAALNMKDLMLPFCMNETYYSLSPSLVPESHAWYNEAGSEIYNQNNPEKAKQLLSEAGYNGQELVFLVSRAYDNQYMPSLVIKDRLESIGVKVKLVEYDWTTYLEKRRDLSSWDMAMTSYPWDPNPAAYAFLDSKNSMNGKISTPDIDALREKIRLTGNSEEQKRYFAELQAAFWDYLPGVKIGDYRNVHIVRSKTDGFIYFLGPVLWNVSTGQ